jgi:hypothetical protein
VKRSEGYKILEDWTAQEEASSRQAKDRYQPGALHSPVLDASRFSTNPDVLLEQLTKEESQGGPNGDWGVFMLAVDYLAVDYMSPQLRSAFYEVMSNIPGTELSDPLTSAVVAESRLATRGTASVTRSSSTARRETSCRSERFGSSPQTSRPGLQSSHAAARWRGQVSLRARS